MIKIEKNETYILDLLPNFNSEGLKMGDSFLTEFFSVKGQSNKPSQINICYILKDNKAEPIRLPVQVCKMVYNCMQGFYKNLKGEFLSFHKISFYLKREEDIILSDDIRLEDESKEYYIDDDYIYYDDIEYQKPLYLFDIKSKYKISFSTVDNQGYMQIVDLKLVEKDPIYKEGDDQSKILNYYKNVKSLQEELNEFKEYLLDQNENILFGEDSNKDAWDNITKNIN